MTGSRNTQQRATMMKCEFFRESLWRSISGTRPRSGLLTPYENPH
jgi:hypothetical protein